MLQKGKSEEKSVPMTEGTSDNKLLMRLHLTETYS